MGCEKKDKVTLKIEEIFKLQESDSKGFDLLSESKYTPSIDSLRESLEYAGKRCGVCVALIREFEIGISEKENKDYLGAQEWKSILQTHKNIYELIGFLTLLQMDSITTSISLLQAKNDTERIMLCKHSYTIIYEAIENDLFKKVAREMKKYPSDLITREEHSTFWRGISSTLNSLTNLDEAKKIRNNIDAHKESSFTEQILTFQKCKLGQSLMNMIILGKVIEDIQDCMYIINKRMSLLYEKYNTKMKEYMAQLETIKLQLEQMYGPNDKTCDIKIYKLG